MSFFVSEDCGHFAGCGYPGAGIFARSGNGRWEKVVPFQRGEICGLLAGFGS